jgi:hypothetical protein
MESVRLYRAISVEEAEDIATNRSFRCVAGSLEGKWFAENREHATAWGLMLFGEGLFRVVSARIPRKTAEAFFRLDRLDNIGPARFAELSELSSAVIDEVFHG